MSGRVAYLERTERGFRPLALRLVGERSDESFRCALDNPLGDSAELSRLADWIRERLPRPGAAGLDVLCLDVEGGLCSWLSSPSAEPGVIAALARQAGGEGWGTPGEGGAGAGVLGGYAGLAQESSVQALATAEKHAEPARAAKGAPEAARQRLAVVAMPDAPARVLLDELDTRGIKVASVCSLWHAMSAAWDPGAKVHARAVGAAPEGDGRVVAESPAVNGTVLVDPRGRLLWAWSGRGGLLAGGSIRLRSAPGDLGAGAHVRNSDLSRLTTEWLGWSAQLGAAPARITCIMPESAGEGALEPRQVGEALGRAWPGATIDLAVENDPMGATLRRLAAAGTAAQDAGEPSLLSPEDPSASLVALTHRPGRAHFRFYLWSAATLLVAAIGIAAIAIKTWMTASRTSLAAAKTQSQWLQAFNDLKLTGLVLPGRELDALKKEVQRLEFERGPVTAPEPAMPILEELETLSHVIGFEGVHLDMITLDSRLQKPRIDCQVDSIPQGEALFAAIKQIGGSNITGWTPTYTRLPSGKTKCSFSGSWAPMARGGAGEGGGT